MLKLLPPISFRAYNHPKIFETHHLLYPLPPYPNPHIYTLPFSPTLITLLLSPLILTFLFPHTLSNAVTNLCKLPSVSPIKIVSSAYRSIHTLQCSPPLSPCTFKPSSPHSLLTSLTILSIYTLNNHGDITQPCLSPTFTSNISPTLSPTLSHALLYA